MRLNGRLGLFFHFVVLLGLNVFENSFAAVDVKSFLQKSVAACQYIFCKFVKISLKLWIAGRRLLGYGGHARMTRRGGRI
jgi:hypothetical protein